MSTNKKIYVIILLAFFTILGGTFAKRYLFAPEISLKEIKIETLSGEAVNLENIKNKVIVLNFWATWCAPCVQEMPMFDNLHESMKGQDVEFILASDESTGRISSFVQRKGFTSPVYRLTEKMKTYGVYTIPMTYIFDKNGNIVNKKLGVFQTAEELQQMIEPYL
ncbi:MAG TPA: TlpA disulfide reductase family protein [Chitinophagales bacterium]|nr:TlpA disulfide reductase family protein [Chitinophagales bacterium]